MEVDRQAQSFDSAAASYERGRPDYPAAALDRVVGALELSPEATIVDLAAGTGKLTCDLVTRFARVIAVEPLDRMRARLIDAVPEAEVLIWNTSPWEIREASWFTALADLLEGQRLDRSSPTSNVPEPPL